MSEIRKLLSQLADLLEKELYPDEMPAPKETSKEDVKKPEEKVKEPKEDFKILQEAVNEGKAALKRGADRKEIKEILNGLETEKVSDLTNENAIIFIEKVKRLANG